VCVCDQIKEGVTGDIYDTHGELKSVFSVSETGNVGDIIVDGRMKVKLSL
jgi:hypothetical protein